MIPGFTSTGSKRPDALLGPGAPPMRMRRAEGCTVWDQDGREYTDCIMALGAVALGYGHPDVANAAATALRDGGVGPLAPVLEHELAERLTRWWPGVESVRFHKTGAEAVAAAVRLARVVTGRDAIVACGYHGWLDGLADAPGVPVPVRNLRTAVPFGSVDRLNEALAARPPAALLIEPVVDGAPQPAWVDAVNQGADASGAVLILDEIKTGVRLGVGGGAVRYGYDADLIVAGKALGNGLPIAAVLGPEALMEAFTRTWVSSTLATEFVSLAAAIAVLDVAEHAAVPAHLSQIGRQFYDGLAALAASHPQLGICVRGIPEFCYLAADEPLGIRIAQACARRGVLFKRNAYNFVSLAHDEKIVARILECVADALGEVSRVD